MGGVIASILGTRGSLMLDVVFLATFAIVIVLAYSIYLVRFRKKYRWHARIQIVLFSVLLVAVTAFEIDIRFFTAWRKLAEPSPFYANGWVDRMLAVHLCFSVPAPILWLATVVLGVRWFGWDATPNRHAPRHRLLGWISAAVMVMTTTTGWIFYYMAFVV
jgi:uncharacterized membrane protein YozB (DUF420 family)